MKVDLPTIDFMKSCKNWSHSSWFHERWSRVHTPEGASTYIVSSARMDQGVKGPCPSEQADNNSCTIHSFPNSKAQSFYLALKICLKLLEKLHCLAIKSAWCLVYTILGNLTNTRYGTIHSKGVPGMATIFSPGWLLVRGDHPQYVRMTQSRTFVLGCLTNNENTHGFLYYPGLSCNYNVSGMTPLVPRQAYQYFPN